MTKIKGYSFSGTKRGQARRGGPCASGGGDDGNATLATSICSTQDAKSINAQLCKCASCGDIQGLLNFVALKKDSMNCVNLSTAMHKLAHLVKERNVSIHLSDNRFAMLHD